MRLLVNVNEKKQNQIKAESFSFFVKEPKWQAFQNELRDDTPWWEKADYGGLGFVLQRRFTVQEPHLSLGCVSDPSLFLCPDKLLSTISCWLTLLSISLSLRKGCPSADRVKCPVWGITVIELIPVSLHFLDQPYLEFNLQAFVFRSPNLYHYHHIKAFNTKFMLLS